MPAGNWQIYQEWNRAVFLHWKVDQEQLRKHIPEEIEIDLYNGEAWISLVAFTMERIKPRNLIAVQFISNFEELNIRTYVRKGSISGVYFLSIEAEKWLSSFLARKISTLPYRKSNMERKDCTFKSSNKEYQDEFLIEYEIGDPLGDKSDLDLWLTERYAVIQDSNDRIVEFHVHHPEWPIHEIGISKLHLSYPKFNNLIDRQPDLAHYSPGVQVVSWGKDEH